jgi:hypothetical protein
MRPTRPTHQVIVTSKEEKGARGVVGVAWENDWGFTVILNPGTVIDWRMHDDGYAIYIKPNYQTRQEREKAQPTPEPKPANGSAPNHGPPWTGEVPPPTDPDDIPF